MKRFIIPLFLLFCLEMLLAGCTTTVEKQPAEKKREYIQTYEEKVSENSGYVQTFAPVDSIVSVCQGSGVIAKAKYLGYNEFSTIKKAHLFSVEEEYTDLIKDDVIYVYENLDTSFISGKTYYLFLNGFLSNFYPHPVYSRCAPSFLVGEDENGYTFYNSLTLGLDTVDDIGQYIKSEIIEKGLYNKDAAYLKPERIEDACEQADVILIADILTVEESSSSNPYIRYSRYSVDEVLKGDEVYKSFQVGLTEELSNEIVNAAGLDGAYYPLMQSPFDTKIGEQFILLFKINPESDQLEMYSFQNSCFRVDSDEGNLIKRYLTSMR